MNKGTKSYKIFQMFKHYSFDSLEFVKHKGSGITTNKGFYGKFKGHKKLVFLGYNILAIRTKMYEGFFRKYKNDQL